jgi:hypothetical protein
MRRPSRWEFRRHRAVEQGCSSPPPAPPASLSLFREKPYFVLAERSSHKTRLKNSNRTPSQDKIKTMKRQAYGFRDMEFFKLKILAIHETRYALVG